MPNLLNLPLVYWLFGVGLVTLALILARGAGQNTQSGGPDLDAENRQAEALTGGCILLAGLIIFLVAGATLLNRALRHWL